VIIVKYNAERHDINISSLYTELGDRIEADSIEDLKLKVEKLFLMKGEILGDWFGDSGKLCASISSKDRMLRSSGIIMFI
jgi:hypothetical protein